MVRLATYDPQRGNQRSHPSISCLSATLLAQSAFKGSPSQRTASAARLRLTMFG
jgi:hypothetical protein